MKGIRLLLIALVGTAFMATVAFANPAMLPKHPGYPSKGKSPATGQRTANDPGQMNAMGSEMLEQSAISHNSASMNMVSDPNRMRIKAAKGAGKLPDIEGPLNRVNVNPAGAMSTAIR